MSNKGRIPATPVHPKQTRFEQLVQTLANFIALAEHARTKLRQEKRINSQQEFKLLTEMSFARGVLIHMAQVPQSEYLRMVEMAKASPDYEKNAEGFCNDIAPPKSLLVTPEEFAREQFRGAAQGRIAPPRMRG